MKTKLSSLLAAGLFAGAASLAFAHSAGDKDDDGCGCDMPKAGAAKPADSHPLKGVIKDILPDQSALLVKHEAIPGVMGAMTMAFKVDAATLAAAKKGEAITGQVTQKGDDLLLSDVKDAGAKP